MSERMKHAINVLGVILLVGMVIAILVLLNDLWETQHCVQLQARFQDSNWMPTSSAIQDWYRVCIPKGFPR